MFGSNGAVGLGTTLPVAASWGAAVLGEGCFGQHNAADDRRPPPDAERDVDALATTVAIAAASASDLVRDLLDIPFRLRRFRSSRRAK
jgi:hypothetical protein